MSMLYDKATQKITGPNKNKLYTILKYIGAGLFFTTGLTIAVLNSQGKIQMNQMEPYSQQIRMVVFTISKYFQNPFIDIAVFMAAMVTFYKLMTYKRI